MTRIDLTWEEVLLAATVGVRRRVKACSLKRREVHGDRHYRAPWDLDIDAACAEMALAKHLRVYWGGQTDPDRYTGDVDGGYHVRSTDRDEGSLILHESDRNDGIFCLMIGSGAKWRVVGFIRGDEGKQKKWWRQDVPHPAYFVPQRELRVVNES